MKRPGSDAAIRLMDTGSPREWEAAFQSYSSSVQRLSQEKGKSALVELDHWWRTTLPVALASRGAEPYLLKDELVKVVQWKLWIGAWRPSLLDSAKKTNPETVQAKSKAAFQHLPRPPPATPTTEVARVSLEAVKKAVNTMAKDLHGVGPATTSAVLAAWSGGCPFDADEVIDVVKRTGKRAYSLKEYVDVCGALDEKAASLGDPWDAERVRKALWSRAMHSRFEMAFPPAAPAPTTSSQTPAAALATPAAAAPASSSGRSLSASLSGSSDKKKTRGRGGGSRGGEVDGGGGSSRAGAAKRQKS